MQMRIFQHLHIAGGLKISTPSSNIIIVIRIDTLSHYPDEFEKLWFAYPANRRNDWDEAFRIYKQALRHGATLEIIMTALEAAKSSIAWTKDGGQYSPGISKWLQREPWREANLQKAQKENQEQWNSQ